MANQEVWGRPVGLFQSLLRNCCKNSPGICWLIHCCQVAKQHRVLFLKNWGETWLVSYKEIITHKYCNLISVNSTQDFSTAADCDQPAVDNNWSSIINLCLFIIDVFQEVQNGAGILRYPLVGPHCKVVLVYSTWWWLALHMTFFLAVTFFLLHTVNQWVVS